MKKKNKKKAPELSKFTLRQLEVLSNYHEVDYDNRFIIITFSCKEISEYLDPTLSTKEKPYFSKELLAKISDVSHSVPSDFNIKVNLKVDDYCGYDPEVVKNSMSDAFELFAYDVRVETNKLGIRTASLIFIAITLFAWLFFVCYSKLFFTYDSEDPSSRLVYEILFGVGSALLWQAAYFIFLPQSDYASIYYSILDRIKYFSLLDKDGNVLVECSQEHMQRHWVHETKKLLFARRILVIVGTGLLCMASYDLTEVVSFGKAMTAGNNSAMYAFFICLACVIILIVAGIGSVSFYLGKGPFKSVVPFFAGASIILTSLATISYIIDGVVDKKFNLIGLIINILLIGLSITLLVCSILLTKYYGSKLKNPYTIIKEIRNKK